MHRLIVRHVAGGSEPRFVVTRAADNRDADVVTLASPAGFLVEGSPGSELLPELRWYLEEFLDYPFPPRTERAERVRTALRSWGRQAFEALFDSGRARDFYRDAVRDGLESLLLEIRSDDPRVLAWPWEVLEDTESSVLALGCQVERRLNHLADPPPLSDQLPTDQVNILLAIARPYENDVAYRSISRPLVELIDERAFPAQVTVLRPPTFARLQEVLQENPGRFHILHFDGHGGYGEKSPEQAANPYQQQAPVGRLVFETEDGKPDPVDSGKLSALLREHRLPAVVLNACQSGMVDQRAEDAFASVAAAMLKGGVRCVVAMAYSLYVSGAKQFLPAFYRGLFEQDELGGATRAGRKKMFEKPGRVCAVGLYDLTDWLVPVVYQQEKLDFTFAPEAGQVVSERAELPGEAQDSRNPYGLIGRDSALLAIERAMCRQPAGILIHGLGGVGKTTLARGFLKWLSQTGGLPNGALWITFSEVRSAEYVINRLVEPLFGADAMAAPMEEKVEAVTGRLRQVPLVVVWDNLESARGDDGAGIAGLLPLEDLQWLKRILEKLRGGRTKVLITSRGTEDWLGPSNRFKVDLGGLHGEERWEFCQKILDDLGRAADRRDAYLVALMDALGGHPLMMRAVLPRLESMTARAILAAVKGNLAALGSSCDELYDRVMATLRFVQQSLPEDVRPLLTPLGLHERFVDADDLEAMGRAVPGDWASSRIDRLMSALAVAGLIAPHGNNIYELHPALTGFLRSRGDTDPLRDAWERAFVDSMASIADHFAPKELHEQRGVFGVHDANFRHARALATRLGMGIGIRALTQSLAAYALNARTLVDAARLFEELATHSRGAGNLDGEAGAYHQLGIVAEERRDFDAAENWYLNSLTIDEKQGNEHGAAISCHGLGSVTQERRDFDAAEKWYLRSLAIFEKQGSEHDAARSYHALGIVAQERRDFDAAEKWYLKSLAIKEKLGNEQGAAATYHQLGSVAEDRRDFDAAEKWHLKSLAIKEKQGNEHGAAVTYQQLGSVAHERRDFDAAEKWYLRSLAIVEKAGDEHRAAGSYHQLGIVAEDRRDFDAAEKWYLKSLTIKEKQGNEHGAASTYHQLGSVAQERRDFDAAEKWYLKSLAILEKQGNEHDASSTYNQLGIVAQERCEYDAAEKWYLKSLTIREKQGNEHGAAIAHNQLGILALERGDSEDSASRFVRSVKSFVQCKDTHNAVVATNNFLLLLARAPDHLKASLRETWQQAGLPPLPSNRA